VSTSLADAEAWLSKRVAKHQRNRFALERGRGGAAVERVVVRVDACRGQVSRERDGMRRLEHLPRVIRMEEGIVVVQALDQVVDRRVGRATIDRECGVWFKRSPAPLPCRDPVETAREQPAKV